ncbi:hypothetical protein [Tepidibacter hydrothermalis]|uniref:Uncharacterized protein n=1 Tax=Tepidibacter hydrothermalis TaxID=3036126 RepID=A0ABY8E950_9FIRM|nr:hypothetical protein [Tepidibacter hydrothermalis]WFD09423.1 hypothetical protein P4S50_13635 [Tepidibacter hydrothermalis]
MEAIFDRIIVLVLIGFGGVLLSRKKLMVSRLIEQTFIAFIILGYSSINYIKEDYPIRIIIMIIVIVSCVCLTKRRYTIYNVYIKDILFLINDILSKIDIRYVNKDNDIILENAKIKLKESIGCVEINFSEIKDKQLYSKIKNEIKSRLNTIDKKIFPFAGMIYSILGIVVTLSIYCVSK